MPLDDADLSRRLCLRLQRPAHAHSAELRCVELATGKVMWAQPRPDALVAPDGGRPFHLPERGRHLRLLKVNPKKYDEISELELLDPDDEAALLEYPCWAAPILSNGLLYVRGEDRLVCLELIPQK